MCLDRAGSPMNEPMTVHSAKKNNDVCDRRTRLPLRGSTSSNFGPSAMPQKNFTSRRQWHNTLVMVWAAPFLLLTGALVLAIGGQVEGLVIGAAIMIAGLGLALMRDMRSISRYAVRSDKIVLESKNARSMISADDLIDAS